CSVDVVDVEELPALDAIGIDHGDVDVHGFERAAVAIERDDAIGGDGLGTPLEGHRPVVSRPVWLRPPGCSTVRHARDDGSAQPAIVSWWRTGQDVAHGHDGDPRNGAAAGRPGAPAAPRLPGRQWRDLQRPAETRMEVARAHTHPSRRV